MASSSKKKKISLKSPKNDEVTRDSCSDDSEEQNEFTDTEINVDFEAQCPTQADFHGIKQLLEQLFRKARIDLSELADLIIAQDTLSSVIVQSELSEESDDDNEEVVFGVNSIVALHTSQGKSCIIHIRDYLSSVCEKSGDQGIKIREVLSDSASKVGLIISERFVNIPAKISVPIYETLQKDLETLQAKHPDFKFDHFLLISKAYRPIVKGSRVKGKKNKAKLKAATASIMFSNAEEDIFEKEAVDWFVYDVSRDGAEALEGKWDSDEGEELSPVRKVMLIPAPSLSKIIAQVKAELS